jgi:hypothetical protein
LERKRRGESGGRLGDRRWHFDFGDASGFRSISPAGMGLMNIARLLPKRVISVHSLGSGFFDPRVRK